ncbi:PF11689 family protein [Leptospira interrogans serovar Pyrogenes str. 2006006960]|nr:PF11689 family protein [Leptospira interrogans serovar Pyrogenes str. 2006006960]
MDRRSGLKKAHFSSVPTRMNLFTCKKYVFLIKKTLPPPPHPKIGKTQHNAFLWGALENSTQRFPMGRVVRRELSFTEDFVVIPTIDLEIQLFVGLVMALWSLDRI